MKNVVIIYTKWPEKGATKTQTGTSFSSLVSSTNFENKKIKGHEYFLISRSSLNNSDIVVSTMTLTDSNVIQLKNQSGDIVDKLCWGDVTDCGRYTVH
jgi:hypothetical protein